MNVQLNLSVVVVSDYEGDGEKTWKDERLILKALAEQDIDEPFQIIMVENVRAKDSAPDELYKIVPDLKIVFSEESQSAKLKDFGITHAGTDYIAVLEADCLPNRQWLRILMNSLRNHPSVSIVSGRTTYGDESMWRRCCGVLDRSFDNPGVPGETVHVSNNGALYRRTVLEQFPYPEAVTPFQSSRTRMNNMRSNDHKFYFEPEAVMRHAIGGFGFIRDFRRNTGYADMLSHSRQTYSSIPELLWRRRVAEYKDCLRLGPKHLKWRDWPLTFLLWLIVPFLEIPGMNDALKKRGEIPHSSYR